MNKPLTFDKQTRVLITGCGGMLGKAVYERFNSHSTVLATDIDLNEDWLEYLDVRDLTAIQQTVKNFCPNLIINLAALTDLEYCELNPDNTWQTNALGQENICLAAQDLDVPVIYVSTAGIFDGKKDVYNDFDTPNPLSLYGKAKYYGEIVTQRMCRRYFIFRAGWMMGGGIKKDKKFINKIFKQIAAGAKRLHVVDDKVGTPTYTIDFANSMLRVIETGLYGLYNMVCAGSGSRYDVAKEFVKYLGLEDEIRITVVDSDYYKEEYFAVRPPSEKLYNLKLLSRGIMFMRDWRECLAEYSGVFRGELQHMAWK